MSFSSDLDLLNTLDFIDCCRKLLGIELGDFNIYTSLASFLNRLVYIDRSSSLDHPTWAE
jgi:hypothetical protein